MKEIKLIASMPIPPRPSEESQDGCYNSDFAKGEFTLDSMKLKTPKHLKFWSDGIIVESNIY